MKKEGLFTGPGTKGQQSSFLVYNGLWCGKDKSWLEASWAANKKVFAYEKEMDSTKEPLKPHREQRGLQLSSHRAWKSLCSLTPGSAMPFTSSKPSSICWGPGPEGELLATVSSQKCLPQQLRQVLGVKQPQNAKTKAKRYVFPGIETGTDIQFPKEQLNSVWIPQSSNHHT
jgi:hypothetical protein